MEALALANLERAFEAENGGGNDASERADLVVITKIDMLGLMDFDLQTAARNLGAVAPGIEVLRLS